MSSFNLICMSYLAATTDNTNVSLVERIFGLDFQLLHDILVELLVIFILFLALSYFLFNPARKLMQARQDKIKEEMEFSAKEKQDALQLKKEYTAKIKQADQEVEGILSSARKIALKQEVLIVDEAKMEANRIVERANTEAQLEKNKVKDEVKKEIIHVASLMAGKFVTETIDAKQQAHLVDETLSELGESIWQK